MKRIYICFLFLIFFCGSSIAYSSDLVKDTVKQSSSQLSIGFVFQKAVGFYWSNGLMIEYNKGKNGPSKFGFGLTFVNSRFGTALNSNAIPFYELNASSACYFRKTKQLRPLLRLSLGYARANYGSDIYKDLANQSLLCALSTALAYDFKFPVRLEVSASYNFISGDGVNGLGVLYPVYVQYKIAYTLRTKT